MAQVRVRIAPSPTGAPHVGTAYIALFNYAFAKANNGKFILRIEDTDQQRSRKAYEENIFKALRWIGLQWDEGPDLPGDYGPYRQSERTQLYQKHAEKLIVKGGAYRCFCTPERLEKMRQEQIARKTTTKYDGKCRSLSESAVGKKLKDGEAFTIRLKVPKRGKCVFKDRLRKEEIVHHYKEIDDQVLQKSDGFPTYHLANVVDDHEMKISHVIRGEEWISSTPKHILLYDLFGWKKPEFIHMPLLKNLEGTKLSKRKNPTSIFYYQEAGYLPEALLNFLGLMGYSRPEGQEMFNLEEMVADFDIERVSLGGSVFDPTKLNALSKKYIIEKHTPEAIFEKLKEWRLNEEFFKKLIPFMQERMFTLGDFLPLCAFFWAREVHCNAEDLIPKKHDEEDTKQFLQTLLFRLDEEENWDAQTINACVHEIAAFFKWKIREATHPLFVAISGKKVAPPLFESMEILGRNLTRVRIVKAIETLGGISKKKMQKVEKAWKNRERV